MICTFKATIILTSMATWVTIKNRVFLVLFTALISLMANCQEASVQAKGFYSSDFDIDGRPRNITFYIPAGFGKSDTYPLVLMLHAEGENGKAVIKKYVDKLQQLADSSNCIMLFPDAFNGHWSDSMNIAAGKDTINDVGFLSIMIDYFVQRYHCDDERIYACGFFNGGQMAWRLGCNRPGKIAAIAPFIQSQKEAAKKCMPTAVVAIFNTDKFALQPTKKITNDMLDEAWDFLLLHKKMQK